MYLLAGRFLSLFKGGDDFMGNYVLENADLRVTVSNLGAELSSIYDVKKQQEYLWNGDE